MRTVTKAEAERDFGAVFNAAADQPVLIQEAGKEMVLISAEEFEEAQRSLHRERVRAFHEARIRASEEARANGFTDDMLPSLLEDE